MPLAHLSYWQMLPLGGRHFFGWIFGNLGTPWKGVGDLAGGNPARLGRSSRLAIEAAEEVTNLSESLV